MDKKERIENTINTMKTKWIYFDNDLIEELKKRCSSSWIELFYARLFWRKQIVIDTATGDDEGVEITSYHFRGKVYITKYKVLPRII